MKAPLRVERDLATGSWYLLDGEGKVVFIGSQHEVVEKMKKEIDNAERTQ